jgi:hypothetical protein
MAPDNSKLIVSALIKTAPQLAGGTNAQDDFAEVLKQFGARVTLYRQYEEGEHRGSMTNKMREMLRLQADDTGINDFNSNYCSIVVDKFAGRLEVVDLRLKDEAITTNWLKPLLEENDWTSLQVSTYRAAVRDGETYVMVDPTDLSWKSEPAYNGYTGMVCIFEDDMTPIWACKIVRTGATPELPFDADVNEVMELTVYQPGSITKWAGIANSTEVFALNRYPVPIEPTDMGNGFSEVEVVLGNAIPWPLDKVPVVRFLNKFDNYDTVGRSELRPAIPLQDALNRTLHSMVSASEFSAFSIKYSIGIPIDPVDITPGGVVNLLVTSEDSDEPIISEEASKFLNAARVGEFKASPMDEYITQIQQIVKEISQVTSTPIYGVTTTGVLSGEALKQLEIGLVTKCRRFQRSNTDSIRELVELTSEIQANIAPIDESLPIIEPFSSEDVIVVWKPPELVDETATIATLINLRSQAPGLFSDTFYRTKIAEMLHINTADVEQDAERIKKDPAEIENQAPAQKTGPDKTAVPGDNSMGGVATQRSRP